MYNTIKLLRLCYSHMTSKELRIEDKVRQEFKQKRAKAAFFSFAIEYVRPAYTSQTDHQCFKF